MIRESPRNAGSVAVLSGQTYDGIFAVWMDELQTTDYLNFRSAHRRYEDAKRESRVQYCFELYAVGRMYRDQPRTNPLALLAVAARAALRFARACLSREGAKQPVGLASERSEPRVATSAGSAKGEEPATPTGRRRRGSWITACCGLRELVHLARGAEAEGDGSAQQNSTEYFQSKVTNDLGTIWSGRQWRRGGAGDVLCQ
jgi:hypothetical protein